MKTITRDEAFTLLKKYNKDPFPVSYTHLNKCFTSCISFIFSEVLDESSSKIFCFLFPLGSVSVSITRIKDSCVNTLSLIHI